jgi:hypothetical protein
VDLYAQANVSTLASFLGRAFVKGQKFKDFDQFLQAAKQQQLKAEPGDWLPPALLKTALEQQAYLAAHGYAYALQSRVGEPRPQMICTLPDGRKAVARFTVVGGKLMAKSEILPRGR